MPKKSFRKKKEFQDHCRKQVQEGRINDTDGQWITNSPRQGFSTAQASMRAGYKVGR